MAFPTIIFEVAFADDPGATSPTFSDLSSRVLEVSTTRGRRSETDVTETGVLQTRVRNQDRALDPTNASSPYYPNVVPVRQARCRATVLSTTYDMFRGDVEDFPPDWEGQRNDVPLTVLDAFDALNAAHFTTTRSAELSGTRVNAILDAIDWPTGSTYRAIDAGQSIVAASDYEEANALGALQEIARSESGVLFASTVGKVTFHDRHKRITAPYTTVQATFSNSPAGAELPISDARVTYRRERIRNRITVTGTASSYTAVDTASRNRFRRRALDVTVLISDANELQSLAEYLLARQKDANIRVEEIVLEPQMHDNLWAQALGRDQGDRIRAKLYAPGTNTLVVDQTVVIERISHSASGTSRRWVTRFGCSPADTQTYWVLGTSELGTSTRLAY